MQKQILCLELPGRSRLQRSRTGPLLYALVSGAIMEIIMGEVRCVIIWIPLHSEGIGPL